MTFKIFRRGSARCIGLLSAFVTILLCLYYISIGQPAIDRPLKDSNGVGGGGGGVSNMNGRTHLPAQQQQQQPFLSKSYSRKAKEGRYEKRLSKFAVKPAATFDRKQLEDDERITQQNSNTFEVKQQQKQQHEGNTLSTLSSSSPELGAKNVNFEGKCYVLYERPTNITAADEYAKFDFQPEWLRTKEYWDRGFEERFEAQKTDKKRPPLKVIVVPHSHNDPGWLKTFINYFQSDSRQILNLMVTKMQEYTDMTFIWSEISFLQLWWDQAHPTKQRALKRLINSGRFEITTGGWVMTDEANVHLYAMLDQLIEGHQWLRNNLNVTPTVGWSIDPFGHGSTVPYLLSESNFEGAIIQRIHYAWKQWFAYQQKGDFIWTPYWMNDDDEDDDDENDQGAMKMKTKRNAQPKGSLLTHNMPFDIYSIKHSCGPHPFICLNFDFRKIPGEYTEYSIKAQFITNENIEERAQLLLEQYARTASLFTHNVALIPIGDDFRYNKEREVDQQYVNYKKLIDHIMANKRLYNVDISFGTPRDYFNAIRKRNAEFPTFKGDFFVYSDIFSEGRPAYWSGYFTTRPFYKILSSDLEHNLRAAEILFTIAYNTARQHKHETAIKIFEKNYEKMIHARRNLGLFQHHDAITGTSKSVVMRDYGLRLFESIQSVVKMQESAIELLIQSNVESSRHNFLLSELERDNFSRLPRKTPILVGVSGMSGGEYSENSSAAAGGAGAAGGGGEKINSASFVVYNSLAQSRFEVITLRTPVPNVKVLDDSGEEIRKMQINPVWNITDVYDASGIGGVGSSAGRIRVSSRQYEVMFIAELKALSLTTFRVVIDDTNYKQSMASVYCDDCTDSSAGSSSSPPSTPATMSKVVVSNEFTIKSKPAGDIQLENDYMRLLFDEKSGFLKTITRKHKTKPTTNFATPMQCSIKFAAYRSAQFHSGAYLFKTDPEQTEAEKDVLEQYEDIRIIITSGPITSDVTVIYGPFLAHTVRLFNTHTYIDAGIYIENDIDFEPAPKNRETELFMRFITDIDNVEQQSRLDILRQTSQPTITELPVFYSDENGFQYHKRTKVPGIGIEGNYFPITTGAFIQDKNTRLTLLTNHAQGAASYEPGQLETMLDRRSLYDDYRGMGEGIVDSRLTRHKFWLLIEDMPTTKNLHRKNAYQVPSLLANHFSNSLRYPANLYFVESFDSANPVQLKPQTRLLESGPLPCDIHLLNFRTLSEEQLQLFPSTSALFILQRQGYDCSIAPNTDLLNVCALSESGGGIDGELKFDNLKLHLMETTALTGMSKANERQRIKSLSEVALKPMELKTFNLTFAAA